jgi:hypothetical protein
MNDHPVHRDDITALRTEGDLKGYIRSLITPTKTNAPTPQRRKPQKWGAVPIPPYHKPGQWPPGTSPPGPSAERELPPAEWDAAIDDYRTTRNTDEEDQ